MSDSNFCPKCGSKLGKDDEFCAKCGKKLTIENKEDKKDSKKDKNEEIIKETNETKEVNSQEKDKKNKTSTGDIIRYIFAGIFALGSLSNILNGNLYGLVELLFAASLCPIIYRKYLCNYIKKPKTLKVLQIILPIVLFFIFSLIIPNNGDNESYSNNDNDNSNSVFKSETDEEKVKKSVSRNLNSEQIIRKIELNSETNKYDFEISYTNDDMIPYTCADGFKSLVEKIYANEKIGSVKFICKNNSETIYYVGIDDISSTNSSNVKNNMKFYDKDNNIVNTNIEELKKQKVEAYKSSCSTFNYKDVLRSPQDYTGKRAYWFGEIVQVVNKSSKSSTFRVNVSCEKYEYIDGYSCPDTIYVVYNGSDSFIEDDMVKMWGTMNGTQTYESIFGASITIPKFNAIYMELE